MTGLRLLYWVDKYHYFFYKVLSSLICSSVSLKLFIFPILPNHYLSGEWRTVLCDCRWQHPVQQCDCLPHHHRGLYPDHWSHRDSGSRLCQYCLRPYHSRLCEGKFLPRIVLIVGVVIGYCTKIQLQLNMV